jgi:hypothetical protein
MQRHDLFPHLWAVLSLLGVPTAVGITAPSYASDGEADPQAAPPLVAPTAPLRRVEPDPLPPLAIPEATLALESDTRPSPPTAPLASAPGSTPSVSMPYLTEASALIIAPPLAQAQLFLTSDRPLAQAEADPEAISPGASTPDGSTDPELGTVQVRELVEDPDLGILRIRDQPTFPLLAEPPRPKFGFLLARMAIANSDNILLAVNDVGGLTGDAFLRPSLGLALYPPLGPQTAFIATADVGLQRYVSQSSLNYDDLRFRVGVRQGLSPRSYGQLIFGYQELFRPGSNRSQFFKNTSLGLTLGRRDPLATNVTLDSYYLAQFNGAQSLSGTTLTDFSRFFQSAGTYLGYDITPQLQAGVSYQINLIDYTSQERHDTFQQVLGQVAYRITSTVRVSVYGGVSFGRSSELGVQFNDTFFGAALEATVPLF